MRADKETPPELDGWGHLALFTPSAGYFALAAVGASLALPFEGLGFDVCAVHRVTGLPCPGCGLTRAFISMAHGDVLTALAANPFVLVLFPLFVALTAVLFLPDGMRARFDAFVQRRASAIGRVYRVGVFSFLGFGALRFAYFLVSGEWFP